MGYQLGVDLGTTFTAAALARDGRTEPVTLGTNNTVVPSVVYLGDGGLVVGHAAQRRAATDPSRVAREFKRRVGDPTPILLGGSPVAADLLMARLLAWAVREISVWESGPPEALAVTHPANWGPYKLDLLSQAIRHVGLHVDRLVPEPVAAASFYASQRSLEPGSVVAVYDLGGGTFDAALVRSGPGGFEILGQPDGIERLGGIDFDHAVLRYACQAADVDLDLLEPDDPALSVAVAQLREQCVMAKEALSAETAASIPVMMPGVYTEVRLTRTELENMIRPALEETLVALRRTIDSAQLTPADVTAVLLVGGSSRIPLVSQLVMGELGRPIAVDARPKDAIALGAALMAAAHVVEAPPAAIPAASGPNPDGGRRAGPISGALAAPPHPPPPAVPSAPAPAGDLPTTTVRPAPSGRGRPRAARRLPPLRVVAAAVAAVVATAGILVWRGATDEGDTTSTTLVAGTSHACVLLHGEIQCWGADEDGQSSPPEGTEFTTISAGARHTCGVDADEIVACWGDDSEGQATPPSAERFVSLSAGRNHTCGIRADQTVHCWGQAREGQRTPQGDRRYTTISAGWDHTCGLRTDETITCWGPERGGASSPPVGEFVALDAGAQHSCAIRADDTVECWGADGRDDTADPTAPSAGERFTSISAGDLHTCGIHFDDTVACWGDDQYGQSTPPEGRFVAISAGGVHTCGLRPDDSVDCWGALGGPPDAAG
jgi:actin-like ATPase involved in cell morphogenesis